MSRFNSREIPNNVPRLGEQVGLAAPGVTPLPVSAPGAGIALAVRESIDAGARVFGGALSLQTRRELEQRRREAEIAAASDRARSQMEQADQGIAAQDVATRLPAILADVEAGRLAPTPGEDPTAFAQRLAGGLIADGMSDAYASRVRDLTLGPIARARQAVVDREADAQRQEIGQALVADVAASPTPENIERFRLNAARGIMSVPEQDEHLARAMVSAARAGDAAGVEALASSLQDRLPTAVASARALLTDTQEALSGRAIDAAMLTLAQETDPGRFAETFEDIGAMTGFDLANENQRQVLLARFQSRRASELRRQVLADPSRFDAVLEAVRDGLSRPDTDPMHVRPEDAAPLINEAERRVDDAARLQWTTGVRDRATRAALDGDLYGLTGTLEHVLPSGRVASLPADEVRRDAISLAFAQIDQEVQDPQANLIRKADLLTRNHEVYPPWQAALEGGVAAALAAPTAEAGDQPIDPRSAEALALWVNLNTQNPALAQRHTSDESALLLTNAEAILRYVTPGDAAQAMRRAGQIGLARLDLSGSARPVQIAMGSWLDRGQNGPELRPAAERLVAMQVAGGVPVAEAARNIRDLFASRFRLLRGEWVDTRGLHPALGDPVSGRMDGLEAVLDVAATRFLGGDEAEGVDRDDLTFRQVRGTWMLWNRAQNGPASSGPDFTMSEDEMVGVVAGLSSRAAADQSASLERRLEARRERALSIVPTIRAADEDIERLRAQRRLTDNPLELLVLEARLAEAVSRRRMAMSAVNELPADPEARRRAREAQSRRFDDLYRLRLTGER